MFACALSSLARHGAASERRNSARVLSPTRFALRLTGGGFLLYTCARVDVSSVGAHWANETKGLRTVSWLLKARPPNYPQR